jgi:phage terminase small subunit
MEKKNPAKQTKTKIKNKKKIDNLKPADREFVLNYLLLKNGTKAYMQAFPKVKIESARVLASRLLAKVNISEAIQECYEETWKDKQKQISKLFDDLLTIVNADVADYIDEDGEIDVSKIKKLNTFCLAEYNKITSDTANGQNVKITVKLLDKLKAISELTKILNMISDKVEVFGDVKIIKAKIPDHLLTEHIDDGD